MQSWINRETIHKNTVETLLDNAANDYKKPVLTEELAKWLGQLTLLYGLPTTYLVPDERMLPNESMRFFYLDRNWLDRMVDGALSVGVLSSLTSLFQEIFFKDIYDQVDVAQLKLREQLRGETAEPAVNAGGPITGVIFRSQVVSGWPGLEVNAYSQSTPLKILRMDTLAPSVLLCLFEGVPDQVDFIEPGEGIHFGVIREKNASDFTVNLRGLSFGGYAAGVQIDDPKQKGAYLTAPGKLRANNSQPGVVDIDNLVSSIEANMPANSLTDGKINPGGFAIQMVRGAGKQTYKINQTDPYPKCEPKNKKGEN